MLMKAVTVGGGGGSTEVLFNNNANKLAVNTSTFTYVNVPSKPKYVLAMWTHSSVNQMTAEMVWDDSNNVYLNYKTLGNKNYSNMREAETSSPDSWGSLIKVEDGKVGFKKYDSSYGDYVCYTIIC